MEELVERYIKLRDTKQKIAKEMKEKTAKIDAILEKIEAALLDEFNASGMESVRTKCGTAYKSTRTSATVADWEMVLDFIRNNDLWGMLERRVSKDFVSQYREEHGNIPPGVNISEELTINVRRSS